MEQPAPDDKDWTWVLERACPACGFDASAPSQDELGALIRANAAAWRSILKRGDLVAERPPVPPGASPVWSALEYGCHVRDVYSLMAERLKAMLSKKGPTFANWDQDQAAIDEKYGEQDPAKVGYDLAVNAGKVADMVDRVSGSQWERTGLRSTGDAFTVESLVRYLLHDVIHHAHDAEEGYRALRPDDEDGAGTEGDTTTA